MLLTGSLLPKSMFLDNKSNQVKPNYTFLENEFTNVSKTFSKDTIIPEEKSEDVYNFYILEEKPQYPGGISEMQKFILKNIKYPNKAKEQAIQGKVFVNFVINKKGKVEDVKVLRSVHPLLDAEAIRVVKMFPRWTPGKQRGEKVKVSYTVPINFRLLSDE